MNQIGTLNLLSSPVVTLIVDQGRLRSRSLGLSVGGAADVASWRLGNALVGNPPHASALEFALAGPRLVADVPLACVVTGAEFAICKGGSAPNLRSGVSFTLEAGEVLSIQGALRKARGYLCIRGGILAEPILGSCSSLQSLAPGASLRCQAGRIERRFIEEANEIDQDNSPIRILAGPQANWFATKALLQKTFTVSPASNRMGLRLKGPPLEFTRREMTSEPVCPGTIQVIPDGQCIILGVDGQTIGGYPRIAQVIRADLDRVGQLRMGDVVQFAFVDLEHAELAWHEQQRRLQQWERRLRVMS